MKQEKDNYCFCAVLQDIFSEYNIKYSQEFISKNLTLKNNGFKVDDEKVKEFIENQKLNYEFYWHNETPFNERDTFLEEIDKHEGFIALNTHIYKVIGFRDPNLTLQDPKDGSIKTKNLSSLIYEFQEVGGGFGLIKY